MVPNSRIAVIDNLMRLLVAFMQFIGDRIVHTGYLMSYYLNFIF